MVKNFIIIVVALIIGGIIFSVVKETKVEVVKSCKVIELQKQELINSTGKNLSTEIRYLIITDKETFICETSLFNGKFNNSDLFWRLKKDSTYNFKVSGFSKSFFFDYRNLLEVIK